MKCYITLISVRSSFEEGITEMLGVIIVPEGRWDTLSLRGVISLRTLVTVIVFACTKSRRHSACPLHHVLSYTFSLSATSKCRLHLCLHALPLLIINIPPFTSSLLSLLLSPLSSHSLTITSIDGSQFSASSTLTFTWRWFRKCCRWHQLEFSMVT